MIRVQLQFTQCLDCGSLVGDQQTHSRNAHTIPCKFTPFLITIPIPERKKRARIPKTKKVPL